MSDDIGDIACFYDTNPGIEHDRLEQHQLEYDLTWRFLTKYLPHNAAILEVGAATGRYTVGLAKRGHTLTAIDLSSALIEKCRENLLNEKLENKVHLAVADARDLSELGEAEFDAILLMGPLYHLVEEADRELALQQAFGRLKPAGIIFSAFLSRFGVLGDLLKNMPQWIEDQAHVRSLLAHGKRPDDYPRGGFRGYFAHASEMATLHESLGFKTELVAGVEPIIAADDESYNKLQGKQRELWLDLMTEISIEQSIIGTSRHLLYIGRK